MIGYRIQCGPVKLTRRSEDAPREQSSPVLKTAHSITEQMLTREQVYLQLNMTDVHNSSIINGAWRLPEVPIPDDWLCIKLDQTQSNNTTLPYACMAKAAFAQQYEDSLKLAVRTKRLETTFDILLIVLGLSIFSLVYLLMYVFVERHQHPIIEKILNGTVEEADVNDEFSRRLLGRGCKCASSRCHCA